MTMTNHKHAAIHTDQPMSPFWAEIVQIVPETDDISTYWMRFKDPEIQDNYRFLPGQFNMLYLPGFGEAAISISSDPGDHSRIGHTIRHIGNVTHAIGRLKIGDTVGVRGPFGTPWPMDDLRGLDVVIAAGGIGLAPLRPPIYHILRHRSDYGKVQVIYGTRTPKDLLFPGEYDKWRENDIEVIPTVDRADDNWKGSVGVVPMLFYRFRIESNRSAVLTCGPEIMIRFVVFEGLARRVPPDRIHVSLERNMKCGQGSCGHCQLGPFFICKDGPVFSFNQLEAYFNVEEF